MPRNTGASGIGEDERVGSPRSLRRKGTPGRPLGLRPDSHRLLSDL